MKHGYLFNASATGLSGHITNPFRDVIETQAPSALGSVGGYSSARVPGFRFKEVLSFRAAYTQVIGDYSESTDSWDTVITSTVEGLEILGVVYAERIVARIATRHYLRPDIDLPDSIRPAGSTIEGLSIAGHRPDVIWHKELLYELDTYDKMTGAYENPSSDFKARYDASHCVGESSALTKSLSHLFPWHDRASTNEIPNKGGVIATSLVDRVNFPDNTIESRGHVIHVPQFGTVILAQYLPSPFGARIDMIRVELGCAVAGSVAAGCGSSNGQPMPPPHGK